ncbi:MAG: molybdopterin molybdotransferase MoeA [Rhodospirillales bacterium]
MLSVAEARARILAAFNTMPPETVALDDALGRVLAEGVTARVAHPPVPVSAMDGYAVIAADTAKLAGLEVTGESAAGRPFAGGVAPGQCVRIFTGAQVPQGADAIVIQEDATREGALMRPHEPVAAGTYVRPAGLDFKEGDQGPRAGTRLGPRDIALAAAMNAPQLSVYQRPRVGVLSTGDELTPPGEPLGPAGIPGSNGPGLAAFVRAAGGEPVPLGIARDTREDLTEKLRRAEGCTAVVTTGGVSVGDHDLVQSVLKDMGATLDFYRIAMRPGKPLMFGALNGAPVFGLPGNPVSAMVTAVLFLGPALEKAQGMTTPGPVIEGARLLTPADANGAREDYLRAAIEDGEGPGSGLGLGSGLQVRLFGRQDSSMLATLARADVLVIRPPHAPAAAAGDEVSVIRL